MNSSIINHIHNRKTHYILYSNESKTEITYLILLIGKSYKTNFHIFINSMPAIVSVLLNMAKLDLKL